MLVADVRHAVRRLRRDVRLTAFAVATIALGVGATATVFSVIDAILLRPLPFRAPSQLVWISNGDAHDLSERTAQVQYVWALRRDSRALVDVAGFSEFYGVGDHSLTSGDGEPTRITGVPVTQNFFALLGVQPLLGRNFSTDEANDGAPPAVLLAHRLWTRRFASDPRVVGQSIIIDGEAVTVIGVLPASFDFGSIFNPGRRVDYFRPFPLTERTNNTGNTLALVARLRGGATVDEAQRDASLIAARARLAGEAVRRTNDFTPLVRSLRDHVSGALRPALLVLAGGVGLVMLMVCANLSNLLLTRATAREREIAVRLALGAARARLVRQLLVESIVLAGIGAVAGLAIAAVGTAVLARLESLHLPLLRDARVDATALVFTAGAALVTALLFGLMPALRVSTVVIDQSLRDATRGSSGGRRHERARATLVIAEVALTCTLLVGAGLLGRSFLRVLDQDLGFQPRHAIAMRIDPSRRFASSVQRAAYFSEALRRVRETRGIEAAGLTDVLPMGFNRIWSAKRERGAPKDQRVDAFIRVVSDGQLRAMGVPLRAGRDFDASDDSASRRVIVISEALGRRLWPGQNPLGRTLVAGGDTPAEVIGVVGGLRYQAVEEAEGYDLYFPMRQMPDYDAVYVIARGTARPETLAASVRAALRPLDASLPLTEMRPMQDIVDGSTSSRRLLVTLLTGFATFALILASLGVYAVISYGVVQRRREIGIRMALGAAPARVRAAVLARTLRLSAVGLGVGLVTSTMLARVLRSLLYGVAFTDAWTFGGALAVLTAVAALAGYLPARRAAGESPAIALRAEA